MIIRPVETADVPGCGRILAENPLWQRYGVTFESAVQRLSSGLEQVASILVAVESGEVTGFVWYLEKGAFGRSGYVMLIGVSPRQQGQGVGDALMEAAEARMFEKSDDIFLLVSGFNDGAQRFYRRRGYLQVGALPAYILPDVTELVFRKSKA